MYHLGLDNLFLLVVTVFAIRGWYRGFVRSICEVGGLLVAYGGIWFVAPRLGPILARQWDIPILVGTILSSTGLFILCQGASLLAGHLLGKRFLPPATDESPRAQEILLQDRYRGGLLAVFQGLAVVFLAGFVLGLAPRGSSLAESLGADDSAVVDIARSLAPDAVGRMYTAATGDRTVGNLVTGVLHNPEGAAVAARSIVENPKVEELSRDEDFAQLLLTGTPDEIARDSRLEAIITDPQIRGVLADFGLDSSAEVTYDPDKVAQLVTLMRTRMDDVITLARQAARSGRLPPGMEHPVLEQLLLDDSLKDVARDSGESVELILEHMARTREALDEP